MSRTAFKPPCEVVRKWISEKIWDRCEESSFVKVKPGSNWQSFCSPSPPARKPEITVFHLQGFVGNWGQEMLQWERIYWVGGLIHLIRSSRCGGRPSWRPSNARTQRELQAKASQTLLDSYFAADDITQCTQQSLRLLKPSFLRPVWPSEPSNANACCIPYLQKMEQQLRLRAITHNIRLSWTKWDAWPRHAVFTG